MQNLLVTALSLSFVTRFCYKFFLIPGYIIKKSTSRINLQLCQMHWKDMLPFFADYTQNGEPSRTVSCQVEAKKEVPCYLWAPFGMLYKYGSQLMRLRSGKHGEPSQLKHLGMEKTSGASLEMEGNTSNSQSLSAVSIMRMAEMQLSRPKSQKTDDYSDLAKAFGFDSGLPHEHAKHLKCILFLLDAAEKFSNRQYDQAKELLMFALLGSHADHPIERVVSCFAQDLRERIAVEKGEVDLEREILHMDLEQGIMDIKTSIHAYEQKLPFTQISHFTGIQTILDSVASAERVHFIDIGQKIGSYWILMMNALANRKHCQLEQLKITVVCTPNDNVEEAGKLLSSFAESMNLPFVFKILHSEMDKLEIDRLELEAGEIVAVYLVYCLIRLSACRKNIETLLRQLKNLNPHVMVISDVEANTSASTFIDRFKDALFLCSAKFDSQEDCLERDNQFRKLVEKLYFQEIISNGVLSEDYDSFNKCRKIDFWREYFARFGLVETELSQLSMHQASLMIRESPCWSSCTLSMNEKTMLIGWNGIPLQSVSAWKFEQDCNTEKDQDKKS